MTSIEKVFGYNSDGIEENITDFINEIAQKIDENGISSIIVPLNFLKDVFEMITICYSDGKRISCPYIIDLTTLEDGEVSAKLMDGNCFIERIVERISFETPDGLISIDV